jgi:HD-like signal output (HDOD) protein
MQTLGDIEAAERAVVGSDTAEVSASIFSQWKFEEGLVQVIKNAQTPQNAPEEYQRAASILHVVRTAVPINGVLTDESVAAAKELVSKYALDMPSFETAIENARL